MTAVSVLVLLAAVTCYLLNLDPWKNWGKSESWLSRTLSENEHVAQRVGFWAQWGRRLLYVWIGFLVFGFFKTLVLGLSASGFWRTVRILFFDEAAPANVHTAWHAASGGLVAVLLVISHVLKRVEQTARGAIKPVERNEEGAPPREVPAQA